MSKLIEGLLEATLPVPPEVLNQILAGGYVAHAWLGHGNVLFLGFHSNPTPHKYELANGERPPFQLSTNYADWHLLDETNHVASIEQEQSEIAEAIKKLAGMRVDDVNAGLGGTVQIKLSAPAACIRTIVIEPWGSGDGMGQDKYSWAWSVRTPDGRRFNYPKEKR